MKVLLDNLCPTVWYLRSIEDFGETCLADCFIRSAGLCDTPPHLLTRIALKWFSWRAEHFAEILSSVCIKRRNSTLTLLNPGEPWEYGFYANPRNRPVDGTPNAIGRYCGKNTHVSNNMDEQWHRAFPRGYYWALFRVETSSSLVWQKLIQRLALHGSWNKSFQLQ